MFLQVKTSIYSDFTEDELLYFPEIYFVTWAVALWLIVRLFLMSAISLTQVIAFNMAPILLQALIRLHEL